jgi:hypothetical protein
MRTSSLLQGAPWAAIAACLLTGCLVKDAPNPDSGRGGGGGVIAGDGPASDGTGGDGPAGPSGTGGTATGGTGGGSGIAGGGAGGVVIPDAMADVPDAPGSCLIDPQCGPDVPTCHLGHCLRCAVNGDCEGHSDGLKVCDTTTGRCVGCNANSDCLAASATPVCGPMHTCIGCRVPGDGGAAGNDCMGNPGGALCATSGAMAGKCVECLNPKSTDCTTAAKPICDTTQNRCAPCAADAECASKDPQKAACNAGECVQCTADKHCTDPTKPICDTSSHVCRACTTDAACVKRNGPNPGVCMSHQNGRCATDAETLYVRNIIGCSAGGGQGTTDQPYCLTQDAVDKVSSTRRVIVLRGDQPNTQFTADLTGAEVSVIGQGGGATISPGAAGGINLTKGTLYVRGVTVKGSGNGGVVAEGNSVLRMDRCMILENTGGLLVNNAGFEINNTIIAGNRDAVIPVTGPSYGGVFLRSAAGKPSQFRYNTIVNNTNIGLQCAGNYQTSGLIVANNALALQVTGCMARGVGITGGDPKLDANFHLTAGSPCINKGEGDAPADDIDGDARDGMSDCGADEFK